MCFGGTVKGQGEEPQVIYIPATPEFMQQFQQQPQMQQPQMQEPQYLPYSTLGGISPEGVSGGQGASDLLTARPMGGGFTSAGNLGTLSMVPGASQLLRGQPSPQYTWA